ncbi:MAG: hypothetical protein ACREAC_30895 [Blastocatellia bacterium]
MSWFRSHSEHLSFTPAPPPQAHFLKISRDEAPRLNRGIEREGEAAPESPNVVSVWARLAPDGPHARFGSTESEATAGYGTGV